MRYGRRNPDAWGNMLKTERTAFNAQKKYFAERGITITYNADDQEFTVKPRGSKADDAYFTSDMDDAFGTANAMLQTRLSRRNPMTRRRRNGNAEVTELEIYIENDGQLYRSQALPIVKNLTAKKASGKYNAALAEKLYMYLVNNGAKKYGKEFGGDGLKMFSVADRKAVAANLRKSFEAEFASGAYDEYIPAKYRAKRNPMYGGRVCNPQAGDYELTEVRKLRRLSMIEFRWQGKGKMGNFKTSGDYWTRVGGDNPPAPVLQTAKRIVRDWLGY